MPSVPKYFLLMIFSLTHHLEFSDIRPAGGHLQARLHDPRMPDRAGLLTKHHAPTN
jgi:hypothetical protein